MNSNWGFNPDNDQWELVDPVTKIVVSSVPAHSNDQTATVAGSGVAGNEWTTDKAKNLCEEMALGIFSRVFGCVPPNVLAEQLDRIEHKLDQLLGERGVSFIADEEMLEGLEDEEPQEDAEVVQLFPDK